MRKGYSSTGTTGEKANIKGDKAVATKGGKAAFCKCGLPLSTGDLPHKNATYARIKICDACE